MTQLNYDPAPVMNRLLSVAHHSTALGTRLDANKADIIRIAASAYIEIAAFIRALSTHFGGPDSVVYGDPFPLPIMTPDPRIVGVAAAEGVLLIDLANARFVNEIPDGPFMAVRIHDGLITDAITADDFEAAAM